MPKGKENLIYLAGLFDGEGFIVIVRSERYDARHLYKNPNYHLDIGIEMSKAEFLKDFAKEFGGTFRYIKKREERYKQQMGWRLSGNLASEFLQSILPFLKVKQEEAKIAINFQDKIVPENTKELTLKQLKERERAFQKIRLVRK